MVPSADRCLREYTRHVDDARSSRPPSSVSVAYTQKDKTFESFFHGSWHGTELVSILNGKIFVRIDHHGSAVEEEILGEHIRLHSRKANASDCSHLKVGVDVCVLSTCRISESSHYDPQQALPLWYDGKIVSKKYSPHGNGCSCLFSVILYKERATNCFAKNLRFERAEVVTIDKIAILQKLNYELCVDGLCRWNCAEDCISYSRSKLLSGLISSQISWLVVFSILKGMCFHIKSVDRKIVYQILEREHESVDHSQVSDINTMYFKGSSEYSRPVIETLSPFVLERVGAETPSGNDSEEEKNEDMEMESESDIEVLYDRKSLRRSKRQKIQPDRFISCYSSNFDNNSKRIRARDLDPKIQPNGFKNFSYTNFGHNTENNALDVDMLEHKRQKQSASLAVKQQCLDCSQFCREKKSSGSVECVMPSQTSAKKVLSDENFKEAQSPNQPRLNVEQIHEEHPSNSQDQLNKHGLGETVRRRRGRPRLIEKGKICSLRVDSLYQKKSTCRKKLLSSLECKELIQEYMGNIRAEMEAEFQSKARPEIIDSDEKEDFIWSTTPEDQIEVEENNDLWKEMEHLLNKTCLTRGKAEEVVVAVVSSGEESMAGWEVWREAVRNEGPRTTRGIRLPAVGRGSWLGSH
ncbi:hypothetical protein KSP39_PZI020811 [Platanthera zijinensis]|uniref:Uncharacterized protein n=1 Tax=Platanthera zijinensis TaxID=2320716 RepID=A0AAP0AZM0_9ASPA